MRWLSTLVFALVTAAGISSAPAATVSFAVTGQPTLDAIPLTYSVSGGASLDTSGAVPVVNMEVTGFLPFPGIGGQYSLQSSVITAVVFGATLEFLDLILLVRNDFVAPNVSAFLTGDLKVTDSSRAENFFSGTLGVVRDNWDLEVAEDLADFLAQKTRLSGAEGFVVANVTLPAPIPLPAALPLYAGALALSALALRRKLRGRGPADQQAA
jgi:hypothetical protein